MECKDSSLYTGITTDIRRRLDQHNGLRKGGARYTRIKRPVFLAHLEKLPNRSEAAKREHELKQWSHREKKALVRKTKKDDILTAI